MAAVAYQAACVHARTAELVTARQAAWAAGLVANPRNLSALARPVGSGQAAVHVERAVALLRLAVARGYRNLAALQTDADLEAVRGTVGYRDLLRQAGALRRYASTWRDDATREAVGPAGLSAEAHLARCRELAAQGYRPAALALAVPPGEKGAVAASVWHRPAPRLAEHERLARRQAAAAATLLHLKEPAEVWPLLRSSPNPTVRSYLVERVGSRRVDPRVLVKRLEVEKDNGARRALIVALGAYTEKELPAAVRRPLVKKLLAWYRDDTDAGIHGAIDWLLRHGKEGAVDRPLDWGQRKELARIDRELARRDPDGKRRWYVNREGQTLTLIQGPVEFRMGSPLWEPDRMAVNERPHRRIIQRNFAMATKPVTVAQWRKFLKERPDVPRDYLERYSPEAGGPIVSVSWFMAAQYCNWLSEKEGIPKKEWCYPEDIKEGMSPLPNHLKRTGYRLPTEAEWEWACRARTASSRSYGPAPELLPRYAWYLSNSQDRTWPVGQKRPNDLGLFDMHGNVATWCQESTWSYQTTRIEDVEDIRNVTDALCSAWRLLQRQRCVRAFGLPRGHCAGQPHLQARRARVQDLPLAALPSRDGLRNTSVSLVARQPTSETLVGTNWANGRLKTIPESPPPASTATAGLSGPSSRPCSRCRGTDTPSRTGPPAGTRARAADTPHSYPTAPARAPPSLRPPPAAPNSNGASDRAPPPC
jgi:formylglycine-generating enzyme required for sulfatase activity